MRIKLDDEGVIDRSGRSTTRGLNPYYEDTGDHSG